MTRAGWYIVACDIANPTRLAKIHRLLKKEGLAVQKSVFFVSGKESDINRLLDNLAIVMNKKVDDIRAYPVTHPKEVWTTGGPLEMFPLIQPGRDKSDNKGKKPAKGAKKKTSWIKRLFS